MLDTRLIEIVLTEQKEELAKRKKISLCKRAEIGQVDLDSNLAQVVTGVRRSGKSTLCFTTLEEAGVSYAYVNFDDERLITMASEDLNNILGVLYKIYGNFEYLFLDEIQNVSLWHLFVNRLLRNGMKIVLTGSNAKLLSNDLATHLTGRHNPISLFPFSFKDFCNYKSVDTTTFTTKAEAFRQEAFDQYLAQGGFPELLKERNHTRYINTLVNNIITSDIEARYKIRHRATFEKLAFHLLNIAPTTIYSDELGALMGISDHTVNNYISYLEEAYLFLSLKKYSPKSKQRIHGIKVYPVDVALMNNRVDAMVGDNLGWRLETIVLIELLRRNMPLEHDIYYYKKRAETEECDFVVCQGRTVLQLIQVSYDISKEKTRHREIRGLIAAAKETNCSDLLLITDHHREDISYEGFKIRVRPAYEWLLQINGDRLMTR